jgi:hypothetical protein
MTYYQDDRLFTNNVHTQLAIEKIYDRLWWREVSINPDTLQRIDIHHGIDYVFQKDREAKTVQERFRYSEYSNYTDFTIRYRRDNNPRQARHESEYYKMKADYFVYGIVNQSKHVSGFQASDFIKYAVVNLKKIYEKIESWDIEIRSTLPGHKCILQDRKIICPVNHNRDGSSSFFPIEIKFLLYLWKEEEIVICHSGII